MAYRTHNSLLYKAALLFMVLIFLCACAKKEIVEVDDVNDLHGLKVGVNVAWECDYVLTGRSDMEIYRYDMTADMLCSDSSQRHMIQIYSKDFESDPLREPYIDEPNLRILEHYSQFLFSKETKHGWNISIQMCS